MKKSLLHLSLMALFIGFFTACELDSLTSASKLQDSEGVVAENANAQMQVVKVFENVNNFAFAADGMKSAYDGDPEVSFEGNTMTLDFTDVSNANGKIMVAFSGPIMYAEGLTASVTFDEYVNDGTGMDGELSLSITEYVPDTKIEFTLASSGLTMTEDTTSYLWSCNQQLFWETGFNTPMDGSDDQYLLNGTSSQEINGVVNDTEQTDVLNAATCDYILSGILVLTQDANSDDPFVITCDFGVGETEDDFGQCDGWVELSADGLPTMKIEL